MYIQSSSPPLFCNFFLQLLFVPSSTCHSPQQGPYNTNTTNPPCVSNMEARTTYNNGSTNTKSIPCYHCAGPLSKDMETSKWTVPPLIRDSFSMIGSAVGGTTSAFYGFNVVMPIVRRQVKGPMWVHFLIGAPPVIVFSSTCAGLAGGAIPALAQLASSSYHAAISLSSPPREDEKI